MARPLNVGLIGGGKGAFIVHPHQKAIHFDGTRRVTAGALFPDPKIALEEAANWPYPIKGYGSYTEMIEAQKSLPEEERLDYVLIVTPNHVHFDPAMKAIKAGIPVFCEKPLAYREDEAEAMVETAAATGTTLMVGYNRRFAATVRVAKETALVSRPELLLAEKSKPTKPGARVHLLEFASHALDTLLWLAGSGVEDLNVQARMGEDGATEESLSALIRFHNGALGVFAMNTHGAHFVERYEAYTDSATVLVEYPVRARRYTREPLPLSAELASRLVAPPADREVGQIDGEPILQLEGSLCPTDEVAALGFRAELEHFCRCIRSGATPLTSGAEALVTQRVAHRIYREAGVVVP